MKFTLLIGFVLAAAAATATDQDLFAAVKEDDGEKILAALNNGADINAIGVGGQTPLMHAVLNGKATAVKTLLFRNADVTIAEQDGYTPMHGAGFQGRAEIAKLLLEHGQLDPSDRHHDGYTPIHRACWGREQRHADTVKVLLDAGKVSPLEKGADGRTPLEMTRNEATKMVLQAKLKEMKDRLESESEHEL